VLLVDQRLHDVKETQSKAVQFPSGVAEGYRGIAVTPVAKGTGRRQSHSDASRLPSPVFRSFPGEGLGDAKGYCPG